MTMLKNDFYPLLRIDVRGAAMAKTKSKLTEKEQRVAIDFLEELIFSNTVVPEGFYDKMMKKYALMNDPFTHLPCTPEEYSKNSLEYDRQIMIEKYGHCDGLD